MEQIRIIKEMRKHEADTGRTGQFLRPRYMVWENVPGALSSNKGSDFAAVLEETIRIAEPEAPGIEVPEKGWPTWGGYRDMDGRWSVYWRVLDAQYFGVPQRRRRIALVADFGGCTAPEILFERSGVYGHPAQSGAAGEGTAGTVENSASYAVRIRGGCEGGGKGALVQKEKSGTLGTGNDQTVFCLQGNGIDCKTPWETQSNRVYSADGKWPTLSANENGGQNRQSVFCLQGNGIDCKTPWETQSNRVYSADGKWPALSANENGGQNRQSVYCLQGNGIDRSDTAGCNGKGWREDVSYTLNTIDRPAVCAGFKLGNSGNARSIGYSDEQSPTLNAECGGNKPAVVYAYGETGAGYWQNGVQTLRAEGENRPSRPSNVVCFNGETVTSKTNASNPHDGDPFHTIGATGAGRAIVIENNVKAFSFDSLASNSMKSSNPHSGCREVEVAKTLDTTVPEPSKNQGGITILEISHATDVIRECGDTVPTLQSRMGTGGNQIPLAYGVGNGQLNEARCMATEKAQTLNTMHAAQAVMQNMAVRRLTPLECERLQGMPDYWTDIGAWRDEKGKLHKESSDAARYKAIGNSIAIPPWKWVLKRLCAQYERDATMGSLFDGLGCFPLIWTQLNGWGSVKWASEIEPFCIAVTKRHFGDDETGERGDMWEYLTGGKKHEP